MGEPRVLASAGGPPWIFFNLAIVFPVSPSFFRPARRPTGRDAEPTEVRPMAFQQFRQSQSARVRRPYESK
jgi:hypothetical protein